MLTYVINTSENETFDSSKLFELAGYSKIRWIQCSLKDIPKCVDLISEKQNSVIADDFRIAVIVDFFGFDKIRIPYGRRGYISDEGVDMGLYMPYIEVYLLDNLILRLENKELYASDFDIYYVQNEKSERYELFNSATDQIKKILEGSGEKKIPSDEEIELIADRMVSDLEVDDLMKKMEKKKGGERDCEDLSEEEFQEKQKKERLKRKAEVLLSRQTREDLALYTSFKLYCSPTISLEFPLKDYPYGALEMCFDRFWDAFRERAAIKADLRRHYYVVPYGGGASRAALHTLSLSLYLIHLYEREEKISAEGDMDVEKINSRTLCEVLEGGWRKISAAKVVAKKNNIQYYALVDNNVFRTPVTAEMLEEVDVKEAVQKEKGALPKEITEESMSGEKYYSEIERYANLTPDEVHAKNQDQFDKIMAEYLRKRDETREANVEAEFFELKRGGFLDITTQCPSKEQYNHLVNEKQKQISILFERVLGSEYIEVDYSEEKKKATEAYLEYKKAKAWTNRNIIGDLIFLILAVASAVVPYWLLQLSSYTVNTVSALMLALSVSGLFTGLFVCSVIFQLIPIMHKLKKYKNRLRSYYLDCRAKENYSFSAIRRRYERDLLAIEQTRYELRQLRQLFEENLAKEKNVLMHREMLDDIADCLGSMLNNLEVEPVFDGNESVEGEFDLSKPLHARENKVYQIFSVETIEKLYAKKGRDAQ